MELKRLDKPCELCGEMMHDVTNRRMYCAKCAKVKQKEYLGKCLANKKEKKKTEKRKSTIDEIVKLAKEKGISYGQYVAMYRNA